MEHFNESYCKQPQVQNQHDLFQVMSENNLDDSSELKFLFVRYQVARSLTLLEMKRRLYFCVNEFRNNNT